MAIEPRRTDVWMNFVMVISFSRLAPLAVQGEENNTDGFSKGDRSAWIEYPLSSVFIAAHAVQYDRSA
jgi:hypothetical protein